MKINCKNVGILTRIKLSKSVSFQVHYKPVFGGSLYIIRIKVNDGLFIDHNGGKFGR